MRNLKRDGKKRGKKFVSLSNSNQRINQLITHSLLITVFMVHLSGRHSLGQELPVGASKKGSS